MNKNRLESFSDAVLAIILTIMVLELKAPTGSEISALTPIVPIFLGYVLSFLYIGIYWNNHHHLIKATKKVSGSILWINLILLFWLSLLPFTTAWMSEHYFAKWPTIIYGFILLMASISYFILQNAIIKNEGEESIIKKALGKDHKGKISVILYLVAMCAAVISTQISHTIFVVVALMWIIPDRRIEKVLP
ncbi:MAG: TMEM175 family protein [Methanobrevibacter sp.]|jgi:uncharacterized membrane protein|nr:TMEM175 family protein [Methanobrevibacter sp.]